MVNQKNLFLVKKTTCYNTHIMSLKASFFTPDLFKAWNSETVSRLTDWFLERQRPLPWRINRDPYRIWISEIMLQQTTTAAVIPYFERFIKKFPNVESLALASLEEVYELWTGLGYYSRARNLHAAAQTVVKNGGFPKSYADLMPLPGIGPYASRAISSQAFAEPVGVVDGNVIRVFSRLFDDDSSWWKRPTQKYIQSWSDHLAKTAKNPSDCNQALMELGATVCTPQSPTCSFCPWSNKCLARKNNTIALRPIKKEKPPKELWAWQPQIHCNDKNELMMCYHNKDGQTPLFLANKWTFPGHFTRLKTKPKDFQFKHTITKHDIYVSPKSFPRPPNISPNLKTQMVPLEDVAKISPFSLVQKAIRFII